MSMRHALLAATMIGVPVAASAQPVSGLYIGAGAMFNWMQTETVKRVESPYVGNTQHGGNPLFDPGWGGVASIGYGLGNGVRLEIEGNYRDNTLQSYKGGTAAYKPGGDEVNYGAMANAYYDFSFSDIGLSMLGLDAVNPYVGLGAGYVHTAWRGVNIPLNAGAGYSSLNVNDGYDTLAGQAMIGAAIPLYSVLPGLSLTAEYRFYAIPESRKMTSQLIVPGVASASSVKVGDDYSHAFLVGLRYAFDVPTPPPPPAPTPVAAPPMPAPARTYLVFFDWDRSDLTTRARQIIADAAANVAKVQVTRIEVNGYTDLSGTAAYNQKLSVRRAQAVAGELVKDGVAQSEIDIHGFGESNPLVPTAAGVREPQNRRVEIILK